MPITANANYMNPQMGQIVSNLAAAIYGDPEARAKAGYYGAETANSNASAAKSNAETTGLNLKNNATANLPTIAAAFAPLPGETTDAHIARVTPMLGQLLQAGGGNADDLAKGINGSLANIFAQGGVDDQGRSLTMQGHPVDQNFSPTVQRADQVAGRNAKAAKDQAFGVANIDQAGANSRNDADNKNKLDLLFSAPIIPKPGEKTYLAPNDPRRATIGNDGVIQGAPTVDTVRGQAGADILALPAGQAPSANIAKVFDGSTGPKPGVVPAVTAKASNSFAVAGLRLLDGVMAPDDVTGKKTAANAVALESAFPADQIATAHAAASLVAL